MTNICYAPFIHKYIHQKDYQKLCCMSTEHDIVPSHTNLEQHWQSDYYQDIRRKMLAGEKLDICVDCWSDEENGMTSDRQMYNEKYKELGSPKLDIVKGNEYGSPLDLDLRPSNLCNLKCRMCTPKNSSQLDKEQNKATYLKEIHGEAREDYTSGDVFDIDNLKFLSKNLSEKSVVKFLGGEPTIMPEVSNMLDLLVSSNPTINITTNCTNFNNQVMFDKLKQFQSVTAQLSIDGIGKPLEYIRAPIHWDKAKEVIKQWTNIANKTRIQFTLQALNLFNVYDFVYWVSKTSIPVDANNVYSNWAEINNLPVDIRHKEIERVLSINDKDVQRVLNDSHKSLRKCLEAHLNDTTIGSIHTLARTTKLFDMARKQHIKDYIPEVYSCIKAEYNENQYI